MSHASGLPTMIVPIALHSGSVAGVDVLRDARVSVALQVCAIGAFAGLTVLGAQVRIYLWDIPITLQTVFVYGSGLFLGSRNGFVSMLLYLMLGLVLPVYAGDGYGPSYLFSSVSAGYLFGMPFSAAVIGMLSRHWNSVSGSMLAIVCGSFCLFAFGVAWYHFAAGHATWIESINKGWLRFALFDAAKIVCAGLLYSGVRRLW